MQQSCYGTGITDPNDVNVTVDAGSVAAADLNTADGNTTTAVAATAVTEITGTAASLATALSAQVLLMLLM